MKQFFGKEYWILLALSGAMFLDAIVSYAFNLGTITLAIYFVIALVVAYKRLEWGIVFAFLELFTNPHGKLIFTTLFGQTLPLRMVIFGAVMLAWFALFVQGKARIDLARAKPFLVLSVGAALGFMGLFINNPSFAFQDGNAYIYLLYLAPILSIQWESVSKRLLLQCLAAGATWVTALSFGILYLYTHFTEPQLVNVYLFLRDVRIAEITPIISTVYRVFIQSQFFVIVFAIMAIALLFEKQEKQTVKQLVAILSLAIAVVVLSLSRSFWFGLVLAILSLTILWFVSVRPGFKEVLTFLRRSILSVVIGLFALVAIVLFPFPQRSTDVDLSDVFKQRASSDVAISSRWQLFDPMWQAIEEAPILGNGFGKTVTFISDDPRVRAINAEGIWETYSMEWGWFEVWLKMGIFGLLGFVILGIYLAIGFIAQLKGEHRWLAISFLTSLVFLYATHMFSPYVNHPIGLGFLLFAFIFADQPLKTSIPVMERVRSVLEQNKTATPVLTSKSE